MTNIWGVLGHKNQLGFLSQAVANGKIPHGILFGGPEGVGKMAVARRLAQFLLCHMGNGCGDCPQCKTFEVSSNPDYIEISNLAPIKIEQIRELTYKLSLKPYSAKFKVAVIDSAEEMTDEASNALLKSLEEPKENTIIILVSSNPNRLPKTISSRTQKINFGLVDENEYLSLLPSQISDSQKQAIITQATGRPGVALRIASDLDKLALLEEANGVIARIQQGTVSDRMVVSAEISEWENDQLDILFSTWLNQLRYDLKSNPEARLVRQSKAVSESWSLLKRNANTKLALANLMLNI